MLPGEPLKVIYYLSSNLLIMIVRTMKHLTDADSEALMYLNISEHFLDNTETVLQGIPKLPEMASVANLAVLRPIVCPGQANGRV